MKENNSYTDTIVSNQSGGGSLERQTLDLSKAIEKQKAFKLKTTLKGLLKKIDDQNTGHINVDAFKLLLETHHVRLS